MFDEVDLWSDPAQSFLLSSQIICDLIPTLNVFKYFQDMTRHVHKFSSEHSSICVHLLAFLNRNAFETCRSANRSQN